MSFVGFMSSMTGRLARIIAGVVLIALGFALGGGWLWLIAVGAVPLLAGIFDVCLFGPLFRMPFGGRAARERISSSS